MTALGGWGGMPLRMGGGRSSAEAKYLALRDGMGTAYSRDDSTIANREKRCMALAIARAEAAQERGAVQSLPDLASDRLPDWERALQAPVDPADPPHLRAATCMGILQGNGVADRDNVAAAVSTALGGEAVSVIVAKAKVRSFASAAFGPTATVVAGGGALTAGVHRVYVAREDLAGLVTLGTTVATITVANGDAILVDGATYPGETVHYYLSLSAGSTSTALVASKYGGGPTVLAHYPSNPPTSALHHVAVVVSAATASDTIRRAKIHAVLGTMLPSWTTYSIVTGSPFVLGAGGSELGLGGL